VQPCSFGAALSSASAFRRRRPPLVRDQLPARPLLLRLTGRLAARRMLFKGQGIEGVFVDERSVFILRDSLTYLEEILSTKFFWCGLEDWRFNLSNVFEFWDGACWTRYGLIDMFVGELSDALPPVSPMKPYRVRAARMVANFWDNHKASEVFASQEHNWNKGTCFYVQSHPLYC